MADITNVLKILPDVSEMLYQMYKDETDKESISVRYDQYLAVDDAIELLKKQQKEWETVEMPKENGDYLVTVYDDSASENIVLHCRWEDLPAGTEKRFWLKGKDITDYVIAWMKFPEAYDKTHNPILSDADDAWVSQHM